MAGGGGGHPFGGGGRRPRPTRRRHPGRVHQPRISDPPFPDRTITRKPSTGARRRLCFPSQVSPARGPVTTATILIVEDESLVAMDLRLRLEARGYRVCGIAPTGEEALALLRA